MQKLHFAIVHCAGVIGLLALFCPLCFSQRSGPVALVTEAKGASIRRASLQLQSPVPTYKGDLVFAGDTLIAAKGSLTVSFCPTYFSYSFSGGEIKIERTRVLPNDQAEQRATKLLPFCQLPVTKLETQRDLGSVADRIQTALPGNLTQSNTGALLKPEQQIKLARLNAALKANPGDITTNLAFALALEGARDFNGAVREYQAIARLAPNAAWIDDEKRAVVAQRDRLSAGGGKIIAVVIGISQYELVAPDKQLQFADRDAREFYDYLISPRGGARPADVSLLLNDHARLGDIRVAFGFAFAQARPADTVIVFIAGHGIAQETPPNRGAYILAYESNSEDLPDTAMRMEELQELTDGSSRPHQVQLFVDACHSGLIGNIQNHKFNYLLTDFLDQNRSFTQVFGLLATRQTESSFECSNLQHGAFTYFLLRGLSTTANDTTTKDVIDQTSGRITVDSLTNYVQQGVRRVTRTKQNPQIISNLENQFELADKDAEGPEPPALPSKQVAVPDSCEGSRGRSVKPSSTTQSTMPPDPYSDALQRGLILPGIPGSAFNMLTELRPTLSPEDYLISRNRLLAALENAGQRILLQYLKGEAVPMRREDFERGEDFFAAASGLLSGGDSFIESRRLFCRGRKLIFDRNLPEAISTLEDAIRLDTLGAYSYNALGIAFLEAADYKGALAAFQDAIRLAPFWAYARHNLALALAQSGQYNPAIATYRVAMKLGPEYLYIPYNLGLLHQGLNQPQEARKLWSDIVKVAPQMARAWNAIGLSYYLERRLDKAEENYQTALSHADNQTDLLVIRHNLALLLNDPQQSNDPQQWDQAVRLWRLNLADKPEDLPSLIGLSKTLAAHGQTQAALDTFSKLLSIFDKKEEKEKRRDYTGARLQYAKLLIEAKKPEEAATQLQLVLNSSPENSEAWERLGDLRSPQSQLGSANVNEAIQLYERALKNAASGKQRRQIHRKIRSLKG